MKLLRYLAASLFLALTAFGQNNTSAVFAAGVSSISTTPVSIQSIQVYDTSGTNNLIILYDNDSASSTNRVYAAYTGVTQYTTNVVTTFTNFTGVVQTTTNTLLATVNVTVAAATNQARRVWTATVPANSFTTLTPTTPIGTTYGLQIKANGAGYYNLTSAALP